MPHWLIKSAIHRTISILPRSQKWNEWFQKYITKSLELGPAEFEYKVNCCRRYLDEFLALSPSRADDFTALELGTGWYPIVPIGLFLCGAGRIWSFDIDPLLRRERLKKILDYFDRFEREGKLPQLLPRLRPECVAKLREITAQADLDTPQASLAKLNIHAIVRDAQHTGLDPKTIDLFFSYSVLEYIPAQIQANLYAEFRRLASSNAVLIEFINLKDQFLNFDRSISPMNFLQYSDSKWRWLDSPLIPQTRLRISDYRRILVESGYEIVKETSKSAPPEQLDRVRLDPKFQKYTREDLLVIETWLVARPVPGR
jgi:hypothetical protein